jgi:hypothetical protein
MSNLITYSQQQLIKAISANNQAKYDQLAAEAETVELQKLLGVAFLQDVQNNPLTAPNVALLDGASFVDREGNTIEHKGLRFILAYLIYSEYVGTSYINDTFTGFVKKNRTESESISAGEVRRLQERNRNIALAAWEVTKQFLDINKADYPLWDCRIRKKLFTPKMYGVRTTKKDYRGSGNNIETLT